MSLPGTTERAFDDAFEVESLASGYTKRLLTDDDRALFLDPGPLFDSLNPAQPKQWAEYQKQNGAAYSARKASGARSPSPIAASTLRS